MSDLVNYIYQEAMYRSAEWHRYDVVILGMYNTIAASIRDQHDTLTVTRTAVQGLKAGKVLRFRDISKHEQDCEAGIPDCTSFRDALQLILEHDQRLQEHLTLIEATPDYISYR